MRLPLLLALLLSLAWPAQAQTDPCAAQLARGQRRLQITLDSLHLLALRPAGPCGCVAEGRYRGRRLLALGFADGSLADTLVLPDDSARLPLLPWPGGALRLRLGALEEGLNLTYYAQTPEGMAAPEGWRLALQGIPGLDILPPPPLSMDKEAARPYMFLHFDAVAAGAQGGRLCLLVRRRQLACLPSLSCCTPESWQHFLVEFKADGLGRPVAAGAVVRKLPPALFYPAPPPLCLDRMRPPAPPEEDLILSTAQPIVADGKGWMLNTGKALVRVGEAGTVDVGAPPKSRPSQLFVEGAREAVFTGSDAGAVPQPPQVYYRTGGVLSQADERQAFRLRARWVATGAQSAPLPAAGRPWPRPTSAGRLALSDEALTQGRPLAFLGGFWYLAGQGRLKQPPPRQTTFGR